MQKKMMQFEMYTQPMQVFIFLLQPASCPSTNQVWALHLFLFCFLSRSLGVNFSALGMFFFLFFHSPPPSPLSYNSSTGQSLFNCSARSRHQCPEYPSRNGSGGGVGVCSSHLVIACWAGAPRNLLVICDEYLSLIKSLLPARHCPSCFTYVFPFNLHNYPVTSFN